MSVNEWLFVSVLLNAVFISLFFLGEHGYRRLNDKYRAAIKDRDKYKSLYDIVKPTKEISKSHAQRQEEQESQDYNEPRML